MISNCNIGPVCLTVHFVEVTRTENTLSCGEQYVTLRCQLIKLTGYLVMSGAFSFDKK